MPHNSKAIYSAIFPSVNIHIASVEWITPHRSSHLNGYSLGCYVGVVYTLRSLHLVCYFSPNTPPKAKNTIMKCSVLSAYVAYQLSWSNFFSFFHSSQAPSPIPFLISSWLINSWLISS